MQTTDDVRRHAVKSRSPFATLALATITAASATAVADEISIVADRDNTMFQSQDGELSSGSGSTLYAGRVNFAANDDWRRRALIRFDVSDIPAGSKIVEASVRIRVTRTPPQPPLNVPFTLFRCNAAWGEGGSSSGGGGGAPSQAGDATWFHTSYPDAFWATPGGDRQRTASGSVLIDTNGSYTFTGDGLAADVQGWIDGGANHGWVMTADVSEPRTVRQIASRESGNASNRPTLIVVFEESSGPAADFNGDGAVNGADVGLLLAAWGSCPGCPEDLNDDGVVNGADLGLLLVEWTG
ncbi:MAG: DNRLRE domain-containing protein [Phycisphaerales bacterium]|nr:DNRLRE domain-containing protein [Phycisphaerales bacterium]